MNRLTYPTEKVRSDRVWTNYLRLPMMLHYTFASVRGAELCLLSLNHSSMGTQHGLHSSMPLLLRIFLAYAAWLSAMPLLSCLTSIPRLKDSNPRLLIMNRFFIFFLNPSITLASFSVTTRSSTYTPTSSLAVPAP